MFQMADSVVVITVLVNLSKSGECQITDATECNRSEGNFVAACCNVALICSLNTTKIIIRCISGSNGKLGL